MPNEKTAEMLEEEGKMMTAYYRRHREIEMQYKCEGIFWSPCLRCGADFLDPCHIVGKAEDGSAKYGGYYCKKQGRPRGAMAQHQTFKEGYTKFMKLSEDFMAKGEKAGFKRVREEDLGGIESIEMAEIGAGEEEKEVEAATRAEKEAKEALEAARSEEAKWKKDLDKAKIELAAIREECSNLGADMEKGNAEMQEALQMEKGKCASMQSLYADALMTINKLEEKLSASDPLAFMTTVKAAGATAKTTAGAATFPKTASYPAQGRPALFADSLAGTTWKMASAEGVGVVGGGEGGAGAASGATRIPWGTSATASGAARNPWGSADETSAAAAASALGGPTRRGYADAASSLKHETQVLINSQKLVKYILKSKSDVVSFMVDVAMLVESIEEFFGGESEDLKIKISLLHMGDDVRNDADAVYKTLKGAGDYDLKKFMTDLFAINFPAPWSSLDLAYRELRQGDSTIIEYARKFKLFVGKLELNLKAQVNKFLLGLRENQVRSALYKQNLESLDFEAIVRWAVNLTNNMKLERASAGVHFGEETNMGCETSVLESREGENEASYKIMGVPISEYWKVMDAKGVKNKCFQCFGEGHGSISCSLKRCKFCDKDTKIAKHYSILCPRCPKDLTKFIEARDKAKFNRRPTPVKYTDEYDNYEFESDELSE